MTTERATTAAPRRRVAGRSSAVHSVRTSDDLWARAAARARSEGVTMNYVLGAILEGYAAGLMDLPQVQMTFAPTRSADGS